MTLGCDAGDYRDHCLFGYLEVCARTPEDIEYYADILKRFGEWVDESLAGIPVDKYLNFAWANFDYPDKKYQGAKLVCYFQGCGRDVEEAKSDASNAISSFAGFLLNVA